jgi:hypothetical protein
MILTDGYFQADGHPGNVLVLKGGVVGLLDYGQAKVLTEAQRLAVAAMIMALGGRDASRVAGAMDDMGIVTKHRGDSQVSDLTYLSATQSTGYVLRPCCVMINTQTATRWRATRWMGVPVVLIGGVHVVPTLEFRAGALELGPSLSSGWHQSA